MAELTDSVPASGNETPNPIPYPRPDEKELDTIQVEAQLERDKELKYYETQRLATNFKLEIAKNMGDQGLVDSAQAKLKEIEINLGETVRTSKERVLNVVDAVFKNFGEAMQIKPEQSLRQRIEDISMAEVIYLGHMMNKEIKSYQIKFILIIFKIGIYYYFLMEFNKKYQKLHLLQI